MIPMVMSPGWMTSVGADVAMGLILTKGGSSGSAQMTCRRLPNHSLILSMPRDYPWAVIYTTFRAPFVKIAGRFFRQQESGFLAGRMA